MLNDLKNLDKSLNTLIVLIQSHSPFSPAEHYCIPSRCACMSPPPFFIFRYSLKNGLGERTSWCIIVDKIKVVKGKYRNTVLPVYKKKEIVANPSVYFLLLCFLK